MRGIFVALCGLRAVAQLQGCRDNLPGVWDGYYGGVAAASESYNLSWSTNSTGAFLIEHLLPNPDPWSYALGQMSPDNESALAAFPQVDVTLNGSVSYGCQIIYWNNTSTWIKRTNVTKVHLLFMSHLDVGFTGLIADVVNEYPSTFYPRALSLSAQMRALNGTDRFVYTTHPWLLYLFFHCPDMTLSGIPLACPDNATAVAVRAGLLSGDLLMHAAPFNVEWEVVLNQAMGQQFFSLGKQLAVELGMPAPRTASVRDVPGVTRGLLPLLASVNVTTLSEGVNPQTGPAVLPLVSVWRDAASGASVQYVQHNGGYGGGPLRDSNCARVPGFQEVRALSANAPPL